MPLAPGFEPRCLAGFCRFDDKSVFLKFINKPSSRRAYNMVWWSLVCRGSGIVTAGLCGRVISIVYVLCECYACVHRAVRRYETVWGLAVASPRLGPRPTPSHVVFECSAVLFYVASCAPRPSVTLALVGAPHSRTQLRGTRASKNHTINVHFT